MNCLKAELLENGYFRQEELTFADCDRNKNVRVAALLHKAACYAGYDYDAQGLTHEKLLALREVFLLSRLPPGAGSAGYHHLGKRGQGGPFAAGV